MKQKYLYKYRAIENLERDLAMIANDSFLRLALQTSMMIEVFLGWATFCKFFADFTENVSWK